jgi:hypothetical protein
MEELCAPLVMMKEAACNCYVAILVKKVLFQRVSSALPSFLIIKGAQNLIKIKFIARI